MLCGHTRPPGAFGLNSDGSYDLHAKPPKLVLHAFHFGGRARITVEHLPVPLNYAYGLRDALKAALAVVESEIAEAGG